MAIDAAAAREPVLSPAMPLSGPPEGDRALWVGSVQVAELAASAATWWRLSGGEPFGAARLLIRDGLAVRGFVEVTVRRGRIEVAELRRAIAGQAAGPAADLWDASQSSTPISEQAALVSVVVCTRNRPDRLREALQSVVQLADAHFEVVVVDNASTSDASAAVVAALADPRIRLVSEPVPGVSRARNRGAVESRGELLAFLDDDVIVEPHWLTAIRAGFARSADIGCVTGPVPGGELRAVSQAWFERRVSWGRLLRHREFRLSEPPADLPLFPFQVGAYGTGANMALRRSVFLAIGGLDERLGAGTVVKGGEDLDLFHRVLRAGYALSVEPAALVWHRHRSQIEALDDQIIGYGRGLGAWGAKLLGSPRAVRAAGLALARAVRQTSGGTRVRVTDGVGESGLPQSLPSPPTGTVRDRQLFRREALALAAGPLHYLRSLLRPAPAPVLGGRGRFRRVAR